jgi:quercetin dioxygenase-like cupin family protein
MSTPERRLRRAPAERFAGPEHLFDLNAVADGLRSEAQPVRDGHRQITLFRRDDFALVLFDFDAGGVLSDHKAEGYVAIQALSGSLRVTTPTGHHQLEAGSVLVLAPSVRHDVSALVPSRMLLTVNLVRSEDD